MSEPERGDPRWLTEDQLQSWKAVVALTMTLPAALDAQLKRDTGLNSFDYHVLAGLADRPDGAMGMGELAAFSQGSPSRLSHAVARMERFGWIERRNGEARCVNAHITAAGRRKLVDSAPGHVREVRRLVIDVLTPEQLRGPRRGGPAGDRPGRSGDGRGPGPAVSGSAHGGRPGRCGRVRVPGSRLRLSRPARATGRDTVARSATGRSGWTGPAGDS